MDIFSWAQTKINEAAVLLGFVAVVQVVFLSPTITERGEYYHIDLAIEDVASSGVIELLENSVHLGIEYTVTYYTTEDRRYRFTVLKEVKYNSLQKRFELRSSGWERFTGPPFKDTAESSDKVLDFLRKVRFKVKKEAAYSCVVKGSLKVFNVDDPELEGNPWGNRKPAITFYFSDYKKD